MVGAVKNTKHLRVRGKVLLMVRVVVAGVVVMVRLRR